MEDTLRAIRAQLLANHLGGLDAKKTDRYFIATVLGALGWDLANIKETILDYSVKDLRQGAEIYYALCLKNTPFLLVDVKPLYSDLKNNTAIAKTLRTALYSPANYLVISNGVEWHYYIIEAEKVRLGITVNVHDNDAVEKLMLLNKESLKNGLIETYCQEHPLLDEGEDNNTKGKTRGYKISDATYEGIRALRKKIVNNRQVKDQEISSGLIVETVLSVFLEAADDFIYEDISNAMVLRKRVTEALKKHFLQ